MAAPMIAEDSSLMVVCIRLLRMLRAHHLTQKVPHTHRYVLTPAGRQIISAALVSQQITLEQPNKLAA